MICRAVLEAQYNDTVAILHSEGPSQQRHNKDKTSLCHAAMLMHLTSNNTIIIINYHINKTNTRCLLRLSCGKPVLPEQPADQAHLDWGLWVQNVKGGSGK